MSNDDTWAEWRQQIANTTDALRDDVEQRCSGPHEPVQHRDGKSPWCHACGRTSLGEKLGEARDG
jgi:hypothetical protein